VEAANLETWQALLAAELSPQRALEFGRKIESEHLDVKGFISNSSLSAIEAQRSAAAAPVDPAVQKGIQFVRRDRYPEFLAEVKLPPAGLFCWGDWETTFSPTVAIVGTRGASTYGKAVATKFAEALARSGVTIVSGGALGIDAAAHKGALSVGGKTVAVLAGGVDHVYPAIHGGLFRSIRESGCLVSQFAIGAKPNAYKFLVRNGLIAALSQVTLLIEAPMRSGALRTAHEANDLGRQVLVVPSNIDNLNFAGSHSLIRDGATLVDHPDQVLEVLGLAAVPERRVIPIVTGPAQLILEILTIEPKSVEKIVEATGLDPSTVLSELTMLEVDGVAMREERGYIARL
jgi:DNA processing protein